MSTPFLNFSRIICTNFRQGHASGFWGAGLCSWNCCHTFFAVFPQLFSSARCVRRKIVQNKKFNALSYVELFLVGAGGFEPPKLKAADLQSVPIGHSGTRPYSFVVHPFAGRLVYFSMRKGFCQLPFFTFSALFSAYFLPPSAALYLVELHPVLC